MSEDISREDYMTLQRALRQKMSGDAVLEFVLKQICEKYCVGRDDQVNLETGSITRINESSM